MKCKYIASKLKPASYYYFGVKKSAKNVSFLLNMPGQDPWTQGGGAYRAEKEALSVASMLLGGREGTGSGRRMQKAGAQGSAGRML